MPIVEYLTQQSSNGSLFRYFSWQKCAFSVLFLQENIIRYMKLGIVSIFRNDKVIHHRVFIFRPTLLKICYFYWWESFAFIYFSHIRSENNYQLKMFLSTPSSAENTFQSFSNEFDQFLRPNVLFVFSLDSPGIQVNKNFYTWHCSVYIFKSNADLQIANVQYHTYSSNTVQLFTQGMWHHGHF